MTEPCIGVTLGDPGGVGPEVVLKALAAEAGPPGSRTVVLGDPRVIEATRRSLGIGLELKPWKDGACGEAGIFLKDVPSRAGGAAGRPDRENGEASFRYFEEALKAAEKGLFGAVVTAPVSKASWGLAGLPWKGHTDYLEGLYPRAVMSFWSERLKVALFTHHLSIREALARVRRQNLLDFFRRLDEGFRALRGGEFEFLVAGLNPHAGEDGLLGAEEIEEVAPAVAAAKAEGIRISGPHPPDTLFLRARDRKDAVAVALLHDQGLIAFKLLAFETGVNLTLGLPFPRTSPDHGTAFDIAGKGIADARSMTEAVKLARTLSAGVF